MISQEENLHHDAANEIMSLIIDVHTIMTLTVPNLTGMQEAKFRLLHILENAGSQSMTELCNQMFISKPYMTRLVDTLVSEELVERQPDAKDRRVINISMTDRGMEYLRNMLTELRDHMKSFLSGFSSTDLETICNASAEIHATFSKNPSINNQGTWSFYTALNQKEK
ncbi:MAG TPA: MarR family transcriptional regulator [Methanospirillum sp.]|uniref:MarR family winged helix-turn-helix transcriptional regulator n=1 Tax=Methanospirillum sp. TaxID=45200 RepID=UPI002C9C4C2B|nr:MarR family transcriptional regulator [Methanospirillum sp.]HWQ63291.1 MarR family transcriptional regulator [Methanospirillum sp.]